MEEHLRREVMTNQLSYVAGCALDEARQLLVATEWHFDAALSLYLQEETIPKRGRSAMAVPANTPETPPYFPEALMAFAKLRASEKSGGGGADSTPSGANSSGSGGSGSGGSAGNSGDASGCGATKSKC
ncbi:UBA-like domain-containing protein 1 [Oscarella lobularis]|uniref:UBA-like domain-containing protein 1 n=1 Tax=Oscarella lobularis TaxID=121494 RepID=UPI0033131FBF